MKTFTLLLGFTLAISVSAQNVDKMYDEFRRLPDSTRTKVWWFHGENITTEEGITADLEAYRQAGMGGEEHTTPATSRSPTDKNSRPVPSGIAGNILLVER